MIVSRLNIEKIKLCEEGTVEEDISEDEMIEMINVVQSIGTVEKHIVSIYRSQYKKFLYAIWKDLPYMTASMFKNPKNYRTKCGSSYDTIVNSVAFVVKKFLFPEFSSSTEELKDLVAILPTVKSMFTCLCLHALYNRYLILSTCILDIADEYKDSHTNSEKNQRKTLSKTLDESPISTTALMRPEDLYLPKTKESNSLDKSNSRYGFITLPSIDIHYDNTTSSSSSSFIVGTSNKGTNNINNGHLTIIKPANIR